MKNDSDTAASQGEPRPWQKVASEAGPDLMVARARFDTLINPRTGEPLRRLVLETRDWANVVARTKDGQVIVVRQYRFGSGTVTTEIPGGVVDPGEEPLAAARRELREETGYTSDRWSSLGSVDPNPAFHTNRLYSFLAEDCLLTHEIEPDPGEDLTTGLLSPTELLSAVQEGRIAHSLVLCALARVFDLRPQG